MADQEHEHGPDGEHDGLEQYFTEEELQKVFDRLCAGQPVNVVMNSSLRLLAQTLSMGRVLVDQVGGAGGDVSFWPKTQGDLLIAIEGLRQIIAEEDHEEAFKRFMRLQFMPPERVGKPS